PAVAQGAVEGDERAQKKLRAYNIGDIAASTALYDRLRPYMRNHPHLSMWTGNEFGCPNCGHANAGLTPTGTAYANVTKYRAYQCEKRGTHIRGNRKLADPTHTRSYK